MTSPATRNYVRHSADADAEWLAEREDREAELEAELQARIAANPYAEAAAAAVKRGRRRR